MKGIHLLLAFTLEMIMLAIFGFFGYKLSENIVVKWTLAILLPTLAGVAWGIWAAPKSEARLEGMMLVAFKTVMFGLATVALYKAGYTQQAMWL